MAMILNRNPQPRIPDEIEQRLDDQVRTAYSNFQTFLFVHAGSRFTYPITLVYVMEWLNFQTPPFFNYYNMLIGLYCLFFIFLPVIVVICLDHNFSIMKNDWVQYYFATVECVYIFMKLVHLHHHGILLSFNFFMEKVNIVGSGFILYRSYQCYLVLKNLKQYQHGTRHRISIIPKNIKGA